MDIFVLQLCARVRFRAFHVNARLAKGKRFRVATLRFGAISCSSQHHKSTMQEKKCYHKVI